MSENTDKAQALSERADGREIISPTLQMLIADNPSLLPERQSACQVCRVALWFVEHLKEGQELKVFCPKMNSIIYETANPVSIPLCDGMIQAEEEVSISWKLLRQGAKCVR